VCTTVGQSEIENLYRVLIEDENMFEYELARRMRCMFVGGEPPKSAHVVIKYDSFAVIWQLYMYPILV
jgi:hypothetical protein